MPLLIIRRNPTLVSDKAIELITDFLPIRVAQILSIPKHPEAELTQYDIAIRVEDHGLLDKNTSDLEIMIFANDYPARRKNLKERTAQIVKQLIYLKEFSDSPIAEIKTGRSFVWVLLCPGGFETF